MKKLLCLTAAAVLSLSSCGKSEKNNDNSISPPNSANAVIQDAQSEYENNQSYSETQNEGSSSESAPESDKTTIEKNTKADSDKKYDVDLTVLSSTVVYSEVYNMMVSPEDYLGKTVKMSGSFMVYEGEQRNYYACIIQDATACCSQGIEFILDDDIKYPDDYPEPGTVITVSGIFDVYEENNLEYCQLIEAEFIE